jgi:hypothetical protein
MALTVEQKWEKERSAVKNKLAKVKDEVTKTMEKPSLTVEERKILKGCISSIDAVLRYYVSGNGLSLSLYKRRTAPGA